QGKLVESLRCCTRSLERKGEIKDPALLGQLYMLTAENHFLLSDKESAATYSQLALRALDAQRDPRLLALNLFCRGKYYTYEQQFTRALKQFQLSLLLQKKTSARNGQADCLFEIGSLEELAGRPEDARPRLEEALNLYEKSDNLPGSVATLCRMAEVF